ncbi:hypothetical protein [Candidatus Cyanaurora vandensis]|uniref:hypothetical protein n=1 Tax=Candidatus Cyanaurora vandensis TaxID=2714958 RepID=UPI00257F4A33|nr:hypothetical protein [Candidatus Cyanaurora vandensis]
MAEPATPSHLVCPTVHGLVTWTYRQPSHVVYWQDQPLNSASFTQALARASQNHAQPRVAEYFFAHGVCWSITPSTEIAGRDLVAGPVLDLIAADLLAILVTALIETSARVVRDWPDQIAQPPESEIIPNEAPWLSDYVGRQRLLPVLGWSLCRYEDYHGLRVWLEEQAQATWPTVQCFHRAPHRVADPGLRLTLNLLGYPATVGDQDPRLTLTGLQHHPDSPDLALAQTILIADVGEVPFILTQEPGQPPKPGLPLLIITNPTALHTDRLWVNLIARRLYQTGDIYDYLLESAAEDSLDRPKLAAHLTLQLAAAFYPEQEGIYQQYFTLTNLEDELLTIHDRIAHVLFELEDLDLPSFRESLRQLRTMRGWIMGLQKTLHQQRGLPPW